MKINTKQNAQLPLVIGTNEHMEKIHKLRHNVSFTCYTQAKKLVSEFIQIDNEEDFQKSFVGYVQKYINSDHVLTYKTQKAMEDLSKSITILQFLEQRYKEYKIPEGLNYDHVIKTNEQLEAYQYAVKLCDLLNAHPLGIISLRLLDIPLIKQNDKYSPDYIKICSL
jgi:hypothetical protein